MPRRLVLLVASLCAMTFAFAGCGGGDGDGGSATLGKETPTSAAPTSTTTPGQSLIATVKPELTDIAVYDQPNATEPSRQLDNPWLYDPTVPASKVPQVFLAKQERPDGWVQVLLPIRPNGSTGWVHASDVNLAPNPYRVDVSLAQHTITVHKGADVIYTGPVAIGATDPPLPDVGKPTPTPTGEYYLRVLLQAPDPTTVYGPYAYGLSSHSDTLDSFEGADAEIGIHGNNDPSVLGTDATHGCIRMDNDAITMLAKQLPLGTPVEVRA
jgi:lipoprotein-anchoring transpeptidase ErfK/SrfK